MQVPLPAAAAALRPPPVCGRREAQSLPRRHSVDARRRLPRRSTSGASASPAAERSPPRLRRERRQRLAGV